MLRTLLAPCVVALNACTGLAQQNTWDCLLANSSPEANANTLHGIIFNVDRFVAVGDLGTVMLSTDAIHWRRQPTPTTCSLYGVTAGPGHFAAVGDSGCVLLSTNGSDWSLATAIPGQNLRAIAYGNGVYVVLTDRSQLLVSSNATTWQTSTNGLPQYAYPVGVFFGGNRFVAHGMNGLILSSADGLSWTAANLGVATTFSRGAYGGGVYVVVGHEDFFEHPRQLAFSNDGISWTAVIMDSPNGLWSGLCYGDGGLVGVNGGQVICLTPEPGSGICGARSPPAAYVLAYGLGTYVAVGEKGLISTWNSNHWILRNAPVCPMNSVAYGNDVFIGTDGNSVYSSADGIHFVQAPAPVPGSLTPVTFGNGLFVTGGTGLIAASPDGTNWAAFPTPCSDSVRAVKYANGMWVGLCDGIIGSMDATNWAERVANPGYLVYLSYGANRWVSCGWTGLDGVIWSSPDGIDWQRSILAKAGYLGPIAIQDSLFSIFQPAGYLIPETAFVSNDGVHWTDARTQGPLLAIRQEGLAGELRLSLAGNWGRLYTLQSSFDLNHWSDFSQIINTSGVTSLPITNNLTRQSSVYFRAAQR